MKTRFMVACALVSVALGWSLACGSSTSVSTGNDAGNEGITPVPVDAGTDAGVLDSGVADAGPLPTQDAGVSDAGVFVTINIQGFAFSPANVVVPAGATIKVANLDGAPHSVTSEATSGSFAPGSVNGVSFDTGVIGGHQSKTFTLSATAPSGTLVPWFCTVHGSMMPQGGLTVQ